MSLMQETGVEAISAETVKSLYTAANLQLGPYEADELAQTAMNQACGQITPLALVKFWIRSELNR